MNSWLYAALCVVVPVVWGVGVAVASNALERRLTRPRSPGDSNGSPPPPIDYHI
jgi:hypothetical protein